MAEVPGNFSQRRKLKPLNELLEDDLDYLYSESSLQRLKPRTLIGAEPDKLLYLLEGEVSLLSGGFVTETFTHLDQRALQPLFNESLEEDAAVLTSYGELLEVDRGLFDALYSQAQAATTEYSQLDLSEAEQELFQHLLRAFMNKKLDLPALPEAALKIRKAINDYLAAAARSGLALVWKIVLVVELLGRPSGVGFQIATFFQFFDVAGILAYALAFILVVQAVEWGVLQPLERRLTQWRR